MKYVSSYELFEDNIHDITFYRGAPNSKLNFDKSLPGIYVSSNIEKAKIYNNNIHKYKLRKNIPIRILKIWDNESRDIFDKYGWNWNMVTNPTLEFINTIKKLGFDGFMSVDTNNYYIFDVDNLIEI